MLQSIDPLATHRLPTAEETRRVVRGYNNTWVGGDIRGCAAYLDRDDFHWDGGALTYSDVGEYIDGFEKFAVWTGEQRILSELYGPGEAMILYDLESPVVGTLRGVEHFTVRGNKINRIVLVWDPTKVREFRAAQAASGR